MENIKISNRIYISTDKSKLDVDLIHDFLGQTYWAEGIPLNIVEASIENSVCFGLYESGNQIGFARVITDNATFGYLADVFIVPERQKQGLGKLLVQKVMEYSGFKSLRRWHLVTRDAQGLYERFGFSNPSEPERHMELRKNKQYY
jgi:N-acetylglutamate synthase-like GNAT family acetyltransferase